MAFDLSSQPEIVQQAYGYLLQGWELALSWLLSPAAWSQFALLVLSYLLAVLAARGAKPGGAPPPQVHERHRPYCRCLLLA